MYIYKSPHKDRNVCLLIIILITTAANNINNDDRFNNVTPPVLSAQSLTAVDFT